MNAVDKVWMCRCVCMCMCMCVCACACVCTCTLSDLDAVGNYGMEVYMHVGAYVCVCV